MAYQIHRPDAKQQFLPLIRAQTALVRPIPPRPASRTWNRWHGCAPGKLRRAPEDLGRVRDHSMSPRGHAGPFRIGQQRRAAFPTRRLVPRRVRARGDPRSPGTASSPRQMNRDPWAAHEDSSPRTPSAGTRRPSFSCISCISWFHKPRGADRLHAWTMPPACCRRCVQGSHAMCFNAVQGWNHETHEIHENPSPPAPCNGCGMARFVGEVLMRPIPWDRARPRAHPSCPFQRPAAAGDGRAPRTPHALGPRPSPGASLMPFPRPAAAGTAALPGRPIPWDRARPRAHPSCPSHALRRH